MTIDQLTTSHPPIISAEALYVSTRMVVVDRADPVGKYLFVTTYATKPCNGGK